MNVCKILAIIFISLLDLSKLHEVETEFLELLEEINNLIETKTLDLDSVIGDVEEIAEQQSGSKLKPNSPLSNNLAKENSRCKVEASVLQQDLLGLIENVLQITFPNMVEVNSKDESKSFTLKTRNQIRSEKNIVAVAEMSTKNLIFGGKNLKLILGQDLFREMIIVNRMKNLHNLWFLSDLNFDQTITYIKLMISSLNNKGMFIKCEYIKEIQPFLFILADKLKKQIFSYSLTFELNERGN